VRERTDAASFAYTWHGAPTGRSFGRGLVFVGSVPSGPMPAAGRVVPRYRRLTAASRARRGVPLWRPTTSRALGVAFRAFETARGKAVKVPLFDALFPFARRGAYLRLYGRRGLAEYQALVPHEEADGFLAELEREVVKARAPLVMGSLKLFRGEHRYVRFEGDGVCVTLDLVRTPDALRFFGRLDAMTLAAGGLPHIVKDSRLAAGVVARAYSGYEEFRARRRALDPQGQFRSAMSLRLEL
jgi:FAD/FMN-containing dehydrogenase